MSGHKDRIVVLDRDGVINEESSTYIKTPEEWRPLPGSLDAIARLRRAGFRIFVATNQSGIGRGLYTAAALDLIHARMIAEIEKAGGQIAGVFACPHAPDAGCECRKPRPGLLRQIEATLGHSLAGLAMVGDSARDIEAALAVGARPVLVRTGYGRQTERSLSSDAGIAIFDDLHDAARDIIRATDPA